MRGGDGYHTHSLAGSVTINAKTTVHCSPPCRRKFPKVHVQTLFIEKTIIPQVTFFNPLDDLSDLFREDKVLVFRVNMQFRMI